MRELSIGDIYKHYKGKEYKVIGVATHSETLEKMVAYEAQYGDFEVWVRPYDMFLENVKVNGSSVPRFQRQEK